MVETQALSCEWGGSVNMSLIMASLPMDEKRSDRTSPPIQLTCLHPFQKTSKSHGEKVFWIWILNEERKPGCVFLLGNLTTVSLFLMLHFCHQHLLELHQR